MPRLTLEKIQKFLSEKFRRPVSLKEALDYLNGAGLIEVAREIRKKEAA